MLWDITKELGRALMSYAGYHVGRALGRAPERGRLAPAAKLPDNDVGISAEYMAPVQWPTYRKDEYPTELLNEPLFRLWLNMKGGHKWTHYFGIYAEVFGPRKDAPLRVLEIGVFEGAGLRLWKSYFSHPSTTVVGIDIDASCAKYDAPRDGINVRIGSQEDPVFLAKIVDEFGPFDLIIDDGSHCSSHIVTSFNHLFLQGLKDGGIYFVEDIHANYWQGWRTSRRSFLEICYELTEQMHAHYRKAGPNQFFALRPSELPMDALEVPLVTTWLREIRFFDSIAVLYKKGIPHIPFYVRQENALGLPPEPAGASSPKSATERPAVDRRIQENLMNSNQKLKLDLGCGTAKRDGFTGIDRRKFDGVDGVTDLTQTTWVFEHATLGGVQLEQIPEGGYRLRDSCVTEVVCSNFLEHLEHNQTKPERVRFMNEMWRVMAPGSMATVITPHWASQRAFGDFTHADKPVSEMFYLYLDKQWRELNAPDNDHRFNADGYHCDFESRLGHSLHPDFANKDKSQQDFAINWYKEAALELFATLIARK